MSVRWRHERAVDAGFVFFEQVEARWIVPRGVVGEADDRFVRFDSVGIGFAFAVFQ